MNSSFTGKNILLGISGGIAAYKAADLTSRLIKLGSNVKVVMTKNATRCPNFNDAVSIRYTVIIPY